MRKIIYSIETSQNDISEDVHDGTEKDLSGIDSNCGIMLDYLILSECGGGRLERKQIKGTCKIDKILFADDSALLFNSQKLLKRDLEIADRTFSEYGQRLAYDKTETIVINGGDSIKIQQTEKV